MLLFCAAKITRGRTECARLMTMVPKEALSRGWTLKSEVLTWPSGLPSSSISTTDRAAGLKALKLHVAPFDVEAARTHESAGPRVAQGGGGVAGSCGAVAQGMKIMAIVR